MTFRFPQLDDQYVEVYASDSVTPCRKLYVAMLQRAVLDLKPRNADLLGQNVDGVIKDAVKWIQDDDTRPLSFLWVCMMAEVCPVMFRKEVGLQVVNEDD